MVQIADQKSKSQEGAPMTWGDIARRTRLQRAVCEICGMREGPFHPDFDGYACEECQAQSTERAVDDQRQELDQPN